MAKDTTAKKEWAVVDMDGNIVSRHETAEKAFAAAEIEQRRFGKKQSHPGHFTKPYLPRSVVHLPCGYQRKGQHSTEWWSPGCTHNPFHDEYLPLDY